MTYSPITIELSSDGSDSSVVDVREFTRGSIALTDGSAGDLTFLGSASREGSDEALDAGAVTIEDAEPAGGFYPLPAEVFAVGFVKFCHPTATEATLILKT